MWMFFFFFFFFTDFLHTKNAGTVLQICSASKKGAKTKNESRQGFASQCNFFDAEHFTDHQRRRHPQRATQAAALSDQTNCKSSAQSVAISYCSRLLPSPPDSSSLRSIGAPALIGHNRSPMRIHPSTAVSTLPTVSVAFFWWHLQKKNPPEILSFVCREATKQTKKRIAVFPN